jgi:hypothetical protein
LPDPSRAFCSALAQDARRTLMKQPRNTAFKRFGRAGSPLPAAWSAGKRRARSNAPYRRSFESFRS